MPRFTSILSRLFQKKPCTMDHEVEAHNSDAEEEVLSPARNGQNIEEDIEAVLDEAFEQWGSLQEQHDEQNEQEELGQGLTCHETEANLGQGAGLQRKPWIDKGYVEPQQEVKCEGLAILDAQNYSGFKDLDVNMAKLHFEHELPPGYSIIRRIGRGAFGCCFLVEKKPDSFEQSEQRSNQVVLKVVRGMIKPRRPVLFYKTCTLYTIMISLKASPLTIDNLKFILGMLKFLHTEHLEVHGDLNPGNMMYSVKDLTRKFCLDFWRPSKRWTESMKNMYRDKGVCVLFDFIDHWFSLEDEQYACIIDADIGGKIGEPKIVVNHQHHDPRNATWQVSDDLIGLMNWVVIRTGHDIKSHATRGIMYGITLESLKQVYAHIIGLYKHLDSRFIFNYLCAPEEPFKLKLRPGECYLDELLKGNFLHFTYFKGSYSLASTTTTITSCVQLEVLEVMQAAPVTLDDLRHMLVKIAPYQAKYLSTLNMVVDLLTSTSLHGGVVFVILDKEYKDDLQISSLDNGLLTNLCRRKANSANKPLFMHFLHAFCTHSETDRWEQSLLEDLAKNCGVRSLELSPELAALKMQPKDGAFVLSRSGTVLAAAAHLKYLPQHYQLCKADGTHFGTRHAAALATAEWIRLKSIDGAVFVRSNTSGVHVMLPHGEKLSQVQGNPWIAEDGQKLPQVHYIKK